MPCSPGVRLRDAGSESIFGTVSYLSCGVLPRISWLCCTAMVGHGILHHEIKPLAAGTRLCGSAITVLTRHGDALFIQKATE